MTTEVCHSRSTVLAHLQPGSYRHYGFPILIQSAVNDRLALISSN
jgi:hypothetical protein